MLALPPRRSCSRCRRDHVLGSHIFHSFGSIADQKRIASIAILRLQLVNPAGTHAWCSSMGSPACRQDCIDSKLPSRSLICCCMSLGDAVAKKKKTMPRAFQEVCASNRLLSEFLASVSQIPPSAVPVLGYQRRTKKVHGPKAPARGAYSENTSLKP